MRQIFFSLLGSLLLLTGGCPDEGKPEPAKPAATPAVVEGSPVVPAVPPSEAQKAAAAARRQKALPTTTEIRAGWALEACEAGCDEKQEAIATRLSASAQLVPFTREETPVGLQLVSLKAYSPWISCRLQPGDTITAVGKTPIRDEKDIPAVIRACTLGQALTVERRGTPTTVPGREVGAAPTGKQPSSAPPETVAPGTRDLP